MTRNVGYNNFIVTHNNSYQLLYRLYSFSQPEYLKQMETSGPMRVRRYLATVEKFPICNVKTGAFIMKLQEEKKSCLRCQSSLSGHTDLIINTGSYVYDINSISICIRGFVNVSVQSVVNFRLVFGRYIIILDIPDFIFDYRQDKDKPVGRKIRIHLHPFGSLTVSVHP